jgi:Cd2+/Zn2+-exporting ATPase
MPHSTSTSNTAAEPLQVKIVGMDCGGCAMTIEDGIRKLAGVEQVTVSFTTERMDVVGEVELAAIESRLGELGYKIASQEDLKVSGLPAYDGAAGFFRFLWQQPALRRACLVTLAVVCGLWPLSNSPAIAGIAPLDILFTLAVLTAGGPVFMKGFRALLVARRITIDLLMAVASLGAIAIGATGEAVTVILLFMLGEALEAFSAEKGRTSLRSLLALQPQDATVLRAHNDSHSHEAHDHSHTLPVEEVLIGDRVLVRPGQRIPVDGILLKGITTINQAPVTGESMPVLKQPGDVVMAGTVNGEAAIEIETSRLAAEGTIARIAKLVEQAQADRSPAERFIDRFARWYTPAVVILAALVVVIPVWGFGQPLFSTAESTGWLYRGLAMLIIACPCALVISIPVTVVSGLTRLASLGVLVKGGAQLDRLADIETVAFDKTGTLTHGKPQVTIVHTPLCEHPAANDTCGSCDDVVAVAASVERASEHPVAQAILQAAKNRSGVGHLLTAESVIAHPGKGVSGELSSGLRVVVGTGELFDDSMEGWQEVHPEAETAKSRGDTIMYVGTNEKIVGYIGVQDEIREITAGALSELAAMDVRRVMLTGDHRQSAERIAAQIPGIDDIQADLSPEVKLKAIERLHASYGAVAMVGDGINDAPALARADIGIAMGGGGTAQAMETADVVLMQDDLRHVPLALRMARKSRQIIRQNIALSLVLKLAFLGLAIPGIATLWMAVIADVGATLLVTLNGMRLLRQS